MNIFSNRLPQPHGSFDSGASFFLQMAEDELRAWLRQHGYGERYIEQELGQLREARKRHGLLGPAQPTENEKTRDSVVDQAAQRRRRKEVDGR